MDCDTTRGALSALLDGEDPDVDAQAVDAHLAACPSCRLWRQDVYRLTRQVRLQPFPPAETVPDRLLRRLRGISESRPRHDGLRRLRGALAVVAVVQVAVTLPLLVTGGNDDAWDLLCLQIALAVGFFVCALRPKRAPALVGMVGTGAVLLVVTAIVEVARGKTELLEEAPHAVTLVGWLLLCLLARRLPDDGEAVRLPSPIRGDQLGALWHRTTAALSRRDSTPATPPSGHGTGAAAAAWEGSGTAPVAGAAEPAARRRAS
jgi:predicted anti-sigma-YlaC factor YlaD